MQQRADRLLKRLCQLGIVDFLLISAFDIHRWRRLPWHRFDDGFPALAAQVFDQPSRPVWLYLLAFPFVVVNFGCMVQLLRGRRRTILVPFLVSAAMIALMPLFGRQLVIERMIWEQILTALGYAIGGAIAVILALGLDSASTAARPPAFTEDL